MKQYVSLLAAAFLACLLLVTPQAARANIIETTATLPPTSGGYTLPTICVNIVCLVNGDVSNFVTTSVFAANQVVDGTAQFTGDFYQNIGGTPGAFITGISITADVGFTYFGRTGPDELGTFPSQLTEFQFNTTINGHMLDAMLNSSTPSTGTTSIHSISGTLDGPFEVNSFFDVFAEISIDGGPFVPGPERITSLQSTVPEPSPVLLLLTGIAGATLVSGLRRKTRLK